MVLFQFRFSVSSRFRQDTKKIIAHFRRLPKTEGIEDTRQQGETACCPISSGCDFLQCSQQECHIQRERQNLAHASDIIISQLDCAAYMVLFRMVQKAINFFKGLFSQSINFFKRLFATWCNFSVLGVLRQSLGITRTSCWTPHTAQPPDQQRSDPAVLL